MHSHSSRTRGATRAERTFKLPPKSDEKPAPPPLWLPKASRAVWTDDARLNVTNAYLQRRAREVGARRCDIDAHAPATQRRPRHPHAAPLASAPATAPCGRDASCTRGAPCAVVLRPHEAPDQLLVLAQAAVRGPCGDARTAQGGRLSLRVALSRSIATQVDCAICCRARAPLADGGFSIEFGRGSGPLRAGWGRVQRGMGGLDVGGGVRQARQQP